MDSLNEQPTPVLPLQMPEYLLLLLLLLHQTTVWLSHTDTSQPLTPVLPLPVSAAC
jgi:hypothetical protein